MAQKLSVSAVSLIFVLLSLSEQEAVETMLSMCDTEVRQLIGHNAKMSLLCPGLGHACRALTAVTLNDLDRPGRAERPRVSIVRAALVSTQLSAAR